MMVVLDINYVQLYRQLYFYSDYFLPLYFSNETWVHSEGSIGKVVGIQPGHYKIEFSDGLKEVPIPHVKKLNKVLLHGLQGIPNTKVKIVDWDKDGYVVEWNDRKDNKDKNIVVPFDNIKIIIGGRKTKRRVWKNQSLRLDRNR
jgi:ribosomal protein L21E